MQDLFRFSTYLSYGLFLACVCAILSLLYLIIKQQVRLLMTLDEMQQQLASLGAGAIRGVAAPLVVGEPFPSFRLPDLNGKETMLEDFRGTRVLLVNWSPQCGHCIGIAPELARLQPAFRAHNVRLVLASSSEVDANRKLAQQHELKADILLQAEGTSLQPFEGVGTPVAYLLDEKGRVGQVIAEGAEKVPTLARYAVGEATEADLGVDPHAKKTCRKIVKPKSEAEVQALAATMETGPGTELKKILGKLGIAVTADCPCNQRAATMNLNGPVWCEQNIDTVVGWMEKEATRRGMIFIEFGARFLVRRAIARSRVRDKELTNLAQA